MLSSKVVKEAALKVYQGGASHRLATTYKKQLNADVLASSSRADAGQY
jgi:hypothetical protein